MKKIVAPLLIVTLGLSLFACSAPAPATDPGSGAAIVEQEDASESRVTDGEEEWPVETHSHTSREFTQEEYDLAMEAVLQEAQLLLDTGRAIEIDYESIRIFEGMAPRGFYFKFLDETDVWTYYLVETIVFE